MPPPIPEHVKRFTANPTRPARYRPGKAIQREESSEEEDEEEEEQPQKSQPKRPARPQTRPQAPTRSAQEEEDEDEAGFVTEEEDDDDTDNYGVSIAETGKAAAQLSAASIADKSHAATQDESDEEEEEDESEEDESSEAESSSEDEAPQRKFQRPKFIKKSQREANPTAVEDAETESNQNHRSKSSLAPEVLSSQHTQSTTARRLAEAEQQIKSTIERETAARLAGRKNWDDDDDLPAEALVDDTDGVDPQAEHSAWRLRELHRLKRDREALVAREKELEEIERRRNLTKEEREAEDREYIAKQRQSKEEGRGQAGFMARYHHKGAFFLDDETSQRMRERNLVGAKFQDEITDKSVLPEYMRVRDMTKLGKKGRTRYTDLRGQDTGRFGESVKRWKGSGYENQDREQGDIRGVDERFLPDSDDRRRGGGGPDASGANASELGRKRERRRSESRSRSLHDDSDDADHRNTKRDQHDRDSYRPRSRSRDRDRYRRRRSYSRSPSRSRSRSPPYKSRRRRSPSPYEDVDRDRRRRVAT